MTRLLQPHLLSLSKTQVPFDSIFRTLFWPHGRIDALKLNIKLA
ncbi:hypothetical protein Pint_10068 [Pistacia integerrima]|uniref:Uncharacterized protein n=1 Tax=Pistacia integerrima TaxID=434235 RepID=A0ACC0XKU7_9ROSI|nr:hypothetical protein Pint_10068 [Pistacia integerrima]